MTEDSSAGQQIRREARQLLAALGFDAERQNERSALVFLSLLTLMPGSDWGEADNPTMRTVDIMEWIRDRFEVDYRPNTRETIRRQTLHQFVQAHLIVENPDQPDRPKNSPKWCYQLTPEALAVARAYGQDETFPKILSAYLTERPGLQALYDRERDLEMIPVILPDTGELRLSAGGQNELIQQIIEEFCPRFTPGGQVLYVGDAGVKWLVFDEETLASLGVTVDAHGKMPDVVIFMRDLNWLVLIEAASSHGPVDHKRYIELQELFGQSTAGLVFISAFPSQQVMRKYVGTIAWETDVWCADQATHLIHFDGERFLGPYDS